ERREPNYELVAEIAGECFMPVAYGGGISTLAQVRRLIRCGIEKVVINSAAVETTAIVREAADVFGSQAVVGGIDVRRNLLGMYGVFSRSGTRDVKRKPEEHAAALVEAGAGEIFLNDIDNDGQMKGFDLTLIKKVSGRVNVPVVACGGAGTMEHLTQALSEGGASAVAAGSMFVFQGKRRAVLINYPSVL
ncbi:MAG: imidazole glycerol phosphate synthase subunit HisF, partial [Deltaproteobacteria bacterium]|nr:imidazole glycerol phosphate synthase subunit HisF [Deltaproteobacteria bacterium]